MIHKYEILKQAEKYNLLPSTIEKDYVIGWFLAGIYNNAYLDERLVFKGGTCLKKCFFNVYRFSEDLDFTLAPGFDIEFDTLKAEFDSLINWIEEESGNQIAQENMKFEYYTNPHGLRNIQAKIPYGGPIRDQRRKSWPKIKFDIVLDEILIDEIDRREIFHEYTDKNMTFPKAASYSLHEILAEKIRALYDRCRPRDLYDVVNLMENYRDELDLKKVKSIFDKKCAFKRLKFKEANIYAQYRDECASGWRQQLSHQINQLDLFENYWEKSRQLMAAFWR